MISREFRSIYGFSNCLWGGRLASLTAGNSHQSLTHFCNFFDDVFDNIVRCFIVIAQEICSLFCNTIITLASQSHHIGIRFSFSPTIACSDAQAMVFSAQKTTQNSVIINNQKIINLT